ncbi:MCE family protein [Roseibium sp. RKSG952]|uniref:MlaD family protein n=1 Tax=Roseibium sp. RKSG952 TaxID=2529384 RepID=UPI0012BBC3F7|nr:MCE family protein [Roseibium sp. RKSG952]MTH97801.1 MCE family protein [Roseibium sp. RKSG952]
METRANYVIIGGFMMAVLFGAFGFVYWLAVTAETRENVFVRIIFPAPVTGLSIGGQVQYNGIKVGDVSSLAFDPENPDKVVATVRIRPSTPIRDDTKATLNYTGLTGVAYVDLKGGSPNSPLLLQHEGGQVPTMVAQRSLFDDLTVGARDVLERADSTMKTIDEFLKENSPTVTQTLSNVETFSQALANNSDGVSGFMDSIASATDAFVKLSARMETLVQEGERILAAVPDDKVTEIVDNVASFSESLGDASQGIKQILANAEQASKDLQDFTNGLNQGIEKAEQILAAVDPAQVQKALDGAGKLGDVLTKRSGEIDTLIASSSETMTNVAEVTKVFADQKQDLSELLDGSKAAVDQVNALLASANDIAGAVDPLQISNIVTSVETLGTSLNLSLASVDEIIAAVDPDQVATVVDNTAAIVANINQQTGQINEIILSAKNTVQNFEAVSATVRGEDDRIAVLIQDVQAATQQFTTTLSDASTILQAVNPDQVSNIVGSVESVASGLADQRDGFTAIIASAREAADNVRDMTDNLSQRTPDVEQIITNAKEMTATLNATSVRVQSVVDQVGTMVEGNGEGLIVEATKAATAIRKVAEVLETRVGTIADGLSKFANQGSSDFAAAMSELNRTLVVIQRAVENFDRSPNRVIFGGDDVPVYRGGQRR